MTSRVEHIHNVSPSGPEKKPHVSRRGILTIGGIAAGSLGLGLGGAAGYNALKNGNKGSQQPPAATEAPTTEAPTTKAPTEKDTTQERTDIKPKEYGEIPAGLDGDELAKAMEIPTGLSAEEFAKEWTNKLNALLMYGATPDFAGKYKEFQDDGDQDGSDKLLDDIVDMNVGAFEKGVLPEDWLVDRDVAEKWQGFKDGIQPLIRQNMILYGMYFPLYEMGREDTYELKLEFAGISNEYQQEDVYDVLDIVLKLSDNREESGAATMLDGSTSDPLVDGERREYRVHEYLQSEGERTPSVFDRLDKYNGEVSSPV